MPLSGPYLHGTGVPGPCFPITISSRGAGPCMNAPVCNKWKTASFPMKPAAPGTRDSLLCEDTAESHFRDNPILNNNVFLILLQPV